MCCLREFNSCLLTGGACFSAFSVNKTAAADKKRREDAKIDGADEMSIGIAKDLDFPEWYKRVRSFCVVVCFHRAERWRPPYRFWSREK